MLSNTQEVSRALTIYQFLHELPENDNLLVEFLEMKEQEKTANSEPEIPSYGEEILKEIDEFETEHSVEVFEVQEKVVEPVTVLEEETPTLAEPVAETSEVEELASEEETSELAEELPTSSIQEEILEPEEIEAEVVPDPEPIKEALTTELNDAVASTAPSVADKLSNKSIQKLADSIALNERFLFSNELFNGNMESFKRALTELDHIASKEDANRYIELQLKKENNWIMESETVQSFRSD